MDNLRQEIEKRRTFAIISHPDAGKTTLTEKFLLYGGAINQAGTVKGKATAKHAVSDWMEIEKQRGISVTSSVLQFNYDGYCINILDTPGHQDFSEDTYRTLMAADSAVMVIDASKGVEAQTRKLFKVCVMRHIPIFTFINKMDRDANDTFELLDEIEKELGIATCPINWPIGSGKQFKGVYDRNSKEVMTFADTLKGTKEGSEKIIHIDDKLVVAVLDLGDHGRQILELMLVNLDHAQALVIKLIDNCLDTGRLSGTAVTEQQHVVCLFPLYEGQGIINQLFLLDLITDQVIQHNGIHIVDSTEVHAAILSGLDAECLVEAEHADTIRLVKTSHRIKEFILICCCSQFFA